MKTKIENFSHTKSVRFPAQNQVKTKKKRSSLKFSPVFGLKLGEDQKKGLRPPFVYSNLLPKLQREGDPYRISAYYSTLITLSRRPNPIGTMPLPPNTLLVEIAVT